MSFAALGDDVVVVSGLPRAGTSLWMQMLAAGGLPVLADGVRAPDASNPRGYLEWEPARRLAAEPERIAAARGRAVKVISALLPALPARERYRVIFVERDPAEVHASQAAMLRALGREDPGGASAEDLARHVERVRAWLAAWPPARAVFVGHRETLERPRETAARVLGALDLPLKADAMAAAVDPALWRTRAASGAGVSSRRSS